MKLTLFFLGLFFVVNGERRDSTDPEWWSDSILYQVYPRSFQDSDGDGTGDLQGITSRVSYFVDLGVEAVWISPIYKSPMVDFGYDISDFRDIDPIFGTLDDFDDLVSTFHANGLKVVMDYVPNHSSNQHEWFIKSVAREEPYTDYYVWQDPSGFDTDGMPLPPNNWVSVFRGSAWTYIEERGQFYLHQYTPEQPDLNYHNPLVQQEMNDVLVYWMDLGVDGFRFDAVLRIWEDGFEDEPLSGNTDDEDDYAYLDHVYTFNTEGTKTVLASMYQTIKDYAANSDYDRVNMLEAYLGIEEQIDFYECCSDFPFNFAFVSSIDRPATAASVAYQINEWLDNMPEGRVANWVLGNHDNWRVADRQGEDLVDAFNVISLSLPGVAVTYQGEELGMANYMDITYEQTVDPKGCNCGPDRYNEEGCSRDPERTPIPWSNEANAGFTYPGVETWLPINPDYMQGVNVQDEENDANSHINIYKGMSQLRRDEPTFALGNTATVENGEVLAIGRFMDDAFYPVYATIVNFGSSQGTIDIFQQFHPDLASAIVLISTNGNAGEVVDISSLTLEPKQTIVLRLVAL